jgi:hypothetical protein
MALELRPLAGGLAPASDVQRLLAEEFTYVRSDPDEGLRQAIEQARWIEQAPARLFFGRHQEALERAAKLKGLSRGEALAIEFGDDPGRTLRIVVIPGDSIKFGFRSREEQLSAQLMIARAARVLGCEVVTV